MDVALEHRRIVDSIPLHDGPSSVGMSLPAMLRQNVPGYKQRMNAAKTASQQRSADGAASTSTSSHETKFGRRKQRRWENDRFVGSKHVALPRASDYSPNQASNHPTFPAPPPSAFFNPTKPCIPSSSNTANTTQVFDDSRASDFGRFSLPIKGLQRATRRIVTGGGPGEYVIRTVDAHLRNWLQGVQVFLQPDGSTDNFTKRDARCLVALDHLDSGTEDNADDEEQEATLLQISRLPHALIWQAEDAFVRFLVHAVARYYDVVSFTKKDPSTSKHLIYLLRPNMAKAIDTHAQTSLDTPPTTEWEQSSISGLSASDFDGISSEETMSIIASASEAEFTDDDAASINDDFASEDGEGDATFRVQDARDRPQASGSALPTRLRTSHRPALSDIDSQTDLDRETDDDVEGDVESLAGSVADLSIAAPPLSARQSAPFERSQFRHSIIHPREDSLSRDSSVAPSHRSGYNTAPGRLTRNATSRPRAGWIMPKLSFAQWVLRG